MQCERLMRLVKSWYLQVKDEALAPARMVAFMNKHIAECPVCMVDDEVQAEVNRISRIILPPSKIPKAVAAAEAAARPLPRAKSTAPPENATTDADAVDDDAEDVEEDDDL